MTAVSSKPTKAARFRFIDTDTHVPEPPDLWTSRVSRKHLDVMPRVEFDEAGEPRWRMADQWLMLVGKYANAGITEYPPATAVGFEDAVPAAFDAEARLQWMDEEAIYAAVLYPNILAFDTRYFWEMLDRDASFEAVRAYNDFLTDFASADPNRLLPIAMLPFWDVDAAVAEMKRAHHGGHRGVLWANKFDEIGLPSFLDEHWAPVYETANDLGLSINFHVGFANQLGNTTSRGPEWARTFDGAKEVAVVASGGMRSNGLAIAQLITSPLLERLPELKWVSVEAGAGYIPHLLDAVDWHWHGYGMHEKTNYKPSELFARQCYACFSYETASLPLVRLYPDNFMFSTDFPHVQCIYPGPCSPALRPSEHVETYFGDLPRDLAQKVLTDNAANVYGVDVPAEWPARIPASATD